MITEVIFTHCFTKYAIRLGDQSKGIQHLIIRNIILFKQTKSNPYMDKAKINRQSKILFTKIKTQTD